MQVSSSSNNFQALNAYQKPENSTLPVKAEAENSIQPISPEEPTEIIKLTSQQQLEQDNEAQAAETQATNDARREAGAQQINKQSTQAQVEIYLAVGANDDSSEFSATASRLETLRDVQQQNDNVEAYATYRENQNSLVGTY